MPSLSPTPSGPPPTVPSPMPPRSAPRRGAPLAAVLVLLLPTVSFAADPVPTLAWPLEEDGREILRNLPTQAPDSIRFTAFGGRPAAVFDGSRGYLETDPLPSDPWLYGDFTLALWFNAPEADDTPGDLLAAFDPGTRRGFHLGFQHQSGACTSSANTRNLAFGIDDGTEPVWEDCGRPGRSVLPFALAVHQGGLYAGTFEPGEGDAGGVYRYAGGTNWVFCGSPDPCNTVSALAVHQGRLYAGVTRYSGVGSHLEPSPNLHPGGRIYRYEGGRRWTDCGRPGPAETIWGMASYDGRLLVTSIDTPPKPQPSPRQGLFQFNGGTDWSFLGNPGGRVAPLGVNDGALFAGGFDGGPRGGTYRFEPDGSWTDLGAPPNVDQTYGFVVHRNTLKTATWKEGTVFAFPDAQPWRNDGRLGTELEVMGMAVHNGMLYGGTLPLAQVWRRDPHGWSLTGRLDFSDTEYRRAWSMAVFQGRLFCGVLPSGKVHALRAGAGVSHDHAVPAGWHHLAAVRDGDRLRLHLDGRKVAEATLPAALASPAPGRDPGPNLPWRIGYGEHATFRGALRDLQAFSQALTDREIRRLASKGRRVTTRR